MFYSIMFLNIILHYIILIYTYIHIFVSLCVCVCTCTRMLLHAIYSLPETLGVRPVGCSILQSSPNSARNSRLLTVKTDWL